MERKVFVYGTLFLVIDQITKILIESFLKIGETVTVVKNFFSLTCVYNTGAAFSILEGRVWFLTLLSLVVLIILLKMSKEFVKNERNILAFGMLFGGIFGNLSDRLFLGMVRDFLKFKIFGYNFPVFNVADICITVGIGLLVIGMIKGEDSGGSSSRDRRIDENR